MGRFLRYIFFLIASTAAIFGQRSAVLHEEDRELYDSYFDEAASEFGVPADLLRGLSFSETRWTHMRWEEEDTISRCSGMPRVYGVMGLWDNNFFGFTLREAAQLLGKSPDELKESPLQNIRGAAALLKRYYNELPVPENTVVGSLESWHNAVAKFSGFPQRELSDRRSLEVYSIVSSGYSRDRITIQKRSVDLEVIRQIAERSERKAKIRKGISSDQRTASQPDYPLAKWVPAHSTNFGTSLIQQKFVVVHDVEGSYLGCISWFAQVHNPPSGPTSAHYVLNSHPNGVNSSTKNPNSTPDAPVGEVTQMVEEKYRAYHVGCWNSYMIGIEHEGYYNVTGWYTPECYESSSKLVRYLCDKYNIPKDRNHVIAHQEWQNAAWKSWVTSSGLGFDPTCNTHIDPGANWNWTHYMSLVTKSDTVRPYVTNALPQSNTSSFPAYKDIVIGFNTQMDIASANNAFSITPIVAGTKAWNAENTVLTFNPAANLDWNTAYTITIDTSAKNIAKSRNLGATPFVTVLTTQPLDTAGPVIVKSAPVMNDIGVFTTTDVAVTLDEAVQTSSLSTTVKLYDDLGATLPLANAKNEIVYDRSIISFTPSGLQPNKTYTLKLLPGIKDFYNNISSSEIVIPFSTGAAIVTAGLTLDNFDSNTKGWLQPNQSASSAFIDTTATRLTFTTEKIRAGGAAKLAYKFTKAHSGTAVIQAAGFPPIDLYTSVGLWIAGDASNNTVEIHFSPNDQVLNIGKIFWQGWRFFLFPTSEITGPIKKLTSIVLKQDSAGSAEGKLYFDEMQVDAAVTGNIVSEKLTPARLVLGQNYPNPFNPTTAIPFSLPKPGRVTLRIYDALGREVSTVADETMNSGFHTITFDAARLPSGVYFYQVRTGDNTAVNRMILMK